MLTRRGFLGTMLAAAVGAVANFDPLKGLWVPGAPAVSAGEVVPVTLTSMEEVSFTRNVMDETAELADIAQRFAAVMGERIQKEPMVTLRQVMLQHAGHANATGALVLEDASGGYAGRGHFEPAVHRVVTEAWNGSALLHRQGASLDHAAGALLRQSRQEDVDMLAPIGHDLRVGVPFTNCLVAVATDPQSGLTVRALRFPTVDKVVHTEVEVAGGTWYGMGARARRSRMGRRYQPMRVLMSPGLMEGTYDAPETVTAKIEEFDGSMTRQSSASAFKG